MRPVVTDTWVAWSVGWSVCRSVTLVSPTKMAEPIEMPFALRTWVGGPGNHVLDGVQIPHRKGQFWGGKGASHCKKYRDTVVPYAKTAESIEMPFGLWARMGRRNHVLDGVQRCWGMLPWQSIFGTQFAVTGLVGYNFGCMIAIDTVFDSRGGFWGQGIRWRLSKVVAMATIFGTKIAINCFVWTIAARQLDKEGGLSCRPTDADIADTLCLRNVSMATNFWLSMGYNFGCMIASDTLFDSRGGFSGSSCPIKT